MRLLVTADRNWQDQHIISAYLDVLDHDRGIEVLIEGCARGGDRMAGRHVWDRETKRPVNKQVDIFARPERYGWGWAYEHTDVINLHMPADWPRYRRAAGPIRNRAMLACGVDHVVAFHNDLSKSKGTLDMVSVALTAGVAVEVVGSNPAFLHDIGELGVFLSRLRGQTELGL